MRAWRWAHVVALVSVLIGIGLLVAACGVANRGSRTQEVSPGSASTLSVSAAANRRAAHREARVLLGKAVLPAGAMRVWSEPVGDGGALARPAQVPGLADLVDLHGWWRLDGSMGFVYRFIKAHAPAGARLDGWGRRYPRPTAAFVDFVYSGLPSIFQSSNLNIEIASLGGHAVGVRVDSQVIWTFPKPATERLPASIREIRITRERLGHLPRETATITSLVSVHRLVAMMNGLPIEQPGSVLSCPSMPAQPVILLSFFASSHASPVATATYTGTCGGTQFRIHGRLQRPLDEVYGVVRAAEGLTGLKLILRP